MTMRWKRSLSLCLFLVLLCPLFLMSACGEKTRLSDDGGYLIRSLGAPYGGLDGNASLPWDLVFFDGALYVGGGDYDVNISPEKAKRLPDSTSDWQDCGTIDDEQIGRFLKIGDTLIIPGIDPCEDWSLGNYYRLEEGAFVKYRILPGAVHTFDMACYHGRLFAAIGRDDSEDAYAVLVGSAQEGDADFRPVPFLKEGQPVPTNREGSENRVYELFLFEEELYALYYGELYRYRDDGQDLPDTGVFEAVAHWAGKVTLHGRIYFPLSAKAAFGSLYFFTTDALYAAADLGDPQKIALPGYDAITDLAVSDDALYLLASRPVGENYETTLLRLPLPADGRWETLPQAGDFSVVLRFTDELPAYSFCQVGEGFAFGLGKLDLEHKRTGEILLLTPFAEND